MFERGLALLGFHKQYTYYERALERIDVDVRTWANYIAQLEKKRDRVKQWTWYAMWIIIAAALIYAGSLKRHAEALSVYEHIRSIFYVALPLPAVLVVYTVVPQCMDFAVQYGRKRRHALEEQRRTIIKDLKDSTRFDVIAKIIDKYDPEAKAARLAAEANARRTARTPSRRSRPQVNGAPSSAGAAVMSMLQSTGQALSPICDRLASILADDPSTQAAVGQLAVQLQHALHDNAQLQNWNHELQMRLSKYEDVGGLDMQENIPPGPTTALLPSSQNPTIIEEVGAAEAPGALAASVPAADGLQADREGAPAIMPDPGNGTASEMSSQSDVLVQKARHRPRRPKAADAGGDETSGW